jgi:uncharacterized protein DUF5946
MSAATSPCPGCGLELPECDGPTHPYIGASPACWALYGELLAREYGELRYPPSHRMTVDVYAVQHPGLPERRSIQSVAVHLIALCLVLERGVATVKVRELMGRVLEAAPALEWLEPPRACPGRLPRLEHVYPRYAGERRRSSPIDALIRG